MLTGISNTGNVDFILWQSFRYDITRCDILNIQLKGEPYVTLGQTVALFQSYLKNHHVCQR